MKRKISEFAYGFVLTHELVGALGFLPVAQSVPKGESEGEGKEEPGYGYPLFLQFKASDFLKRRNAGESKLVGLPYFRFAIHRRTQSPQQELLMALEKKGKLVFYVTPKIHESVNLNAAFFEKQIVAGSLFVPPGEIGELPDNESHRIVFSGRNEKVFLCPEGRQLTEVIHGESFGTRVGEMLVDRAPSRLDDNFYFGLAYEMLSLVSPNRRIFDEFSRGKMEMSGATFADYLAKTLFDCELLIIPTPPPPAQGERGASAAKPKRGNRAKRDEN